MPAYNRANLLIRAINSVRIQLYKNWELLIVDDGSTDNTEIMVREIANADARILYFQKENSGPAESRNLGITHARGKYIAFLDSDDEFLPEHLSVRCEYLNDHPEVDFLHGGAQVLGGIERQFVVDKDNPERLIPLSECVIGGTFFSRQGVIESVGGWRRGYAEDADLFDRISAQYEVREIHIESYIYHRDSPDSRCDEKLQQ
jgi:glycosyltransferase involved in cell wall biosynthesis